MKILQQGLKMKENADLRIQREERDFFAMMEALPYGITLINLDKKIYYANNIAKQLTGYQQLEGSACFDIFCDKQECDCPIGKTGTSEISRKKLIRSDGSTIPVLRSVQPVIFNNKHYYLAVMTDIAMQVETENTLRNKSRELENLIRQKELAENVAKIEARKFEMLFEEVADALYVHDFNGNFLKVNQKACDRLGYSREEFASMNIAEVEISKSSETTATRLTRIKKEKKLTFEAVNISRDGSEIPVEIFSTVIEFEGREAILSSVRNISKRKQYEKELIIAKKRAEESDRLKSQFLNNMSHEIRTPLNGIVGFLDLLEDTSISPETKKEYISVMRKSSDRLIETVQTIIDISRIDSSSSGLTKEKINIHNELTTMLTETSVKFAKPDVKFLWELSSELENKYIETQRDNFLLILKHLISNAFKFTTKGEVKLHIEIENNQLKIAVKDTGMGIRESDMDSIFEPFRKSSDTEKLAIEGNGLGLTLAVKLAHQLGGTIHAKSVYGQGSVFTLSLPGVESIDLLQDQKMLPVVELQNKTILIAEDEMSNFLYLQAVLKEKGCKIIHARNGKQALQMGLNGHHIDLILMDMNMPVIDGLSATRKIKKLKHDIPIIAQSAYIQNDEIVLALEAGCDDYLPKPVKPQQLLAAINKHLNRSDN